MLPVSRWITVLSVALVAALLVTATLAQPPEGQPGPPGPGGGPRMGGPGGFGGGAFGTLGLLRIEQVRNELKLGEEQVNQLKDIEKAMGDLMPRGGMRDLSAEERRTRFAEMRKKTEELEKQVKDVLEPEQWKRLQQISLQLRLNMGGAGAFSDPELVKELQISEGQTEKFRALMEKMRESMRGGMNREEMRNLSDEERQKRFTEMREKMEKARKEAMDQAMEILTPDQKKKLDELKGEEFKLDMSQIMRGPGGPGGGRRGGDRGNRSGGGGDSPPAKEL